MATKVICDRCKAMDGSLDGNAPMKGGQLPPIKVNKLQIGGKTYDICNRCKDTIYDGLPEEDKNPPAIRDTFASRKS